MLFNITERYVHAIASYTKLHITQAEPAALVVVYDLHWKHFQDQTTPGETSGKKDKTTQSE